MLGCYIGPAGAAAHGVPERFLNPGGGEKEKSVLKQEDDNGDRVETGLNEGEKNQNTETPPPARVPEKGKRGRKKKFRGREQDAPIPRQSTE